MFCAAFIRSHNNAGRFCVVSRKGNPEAGQVWIEHDHLDGTVSLYTPAPNVALMDDHVDGHIFQRLLNRVSPLDIRERIARELRFDDDIWVISLEMRSGDIGLNIFD